MPDACPEPSIDLPASYRAWRTSELGRITERVEEDLVLELVDPVEGMRVLDVGCSDGVLCVRLARQGADVTGLDTDSRILEAARQRANTEQAIVTPTPGDARSLPFPDDSFDTVVAVTILCVTPDAHRAVSEMARVLRPGGRLVIGELGRYSLWAAKRRIAGWFGSPTWRAAAFRSEGELKSLATRAKLDVTESEVRAITRPAICARVGWRLSITCPRRSRPTAPHIAVAATKPADHL